MIDRKLFIFPILALTVSACVPERMLATDPVIVPTNYGDVTCQLYSKRINWWDRAVSYPNGLSQEKADQLCFEVGSGRRN